MQPLVPADVDLRGLPYMPLDVNRLRDSQLAISASGDEFRAAVLLWCASWNQVPAASLPADDATLAAYAGYGRDVKGWRKVKDGAMRGFVHCSDGRWYHPVVAEKALEAWRERLDYRDKKGNEAERLQRYRDEHRQIRDRLREYGITAPWNAKIEDLRATLQEHELKHSVDEPATRTGALQERNGKRCSTEPETHTGALPATAKKGREGKGSKDICVTSTTETSTAETSTRGCRLSPNWQPNPDELRWARDARPDLDVTIEIERFRDYWIAKPGKDGVKLDWAATWRNWVRNARGIPGAAAPRPGPRRKQLGEGSSTDYGLGGAP